MNEKQFSVGVFVDVANIAMNGGYGMRYDVLRDFACHDNGVVVRLNAYVAYDRARASLDPLYAEKTNSFYSVLRDLGYKVIVKDVRRFVDDEGNTVLKANSDLDMAVDALLQSERLDRVLLITGDGDFIQVVRALQNKGRRVEMIAFDNVSLDLRREVDVFMSGYLIPNLLPFKNQQGKWGEVGSQVRGYCYDYRTDRGFGFMRFLQRFGENLWITDTRRTESPYGTAYFHISNLNNNVHDQLPSRNIFFEFDLEKATRGEGMEAKNITVCTELSG